eukprot:9057166-Alexandrium_andersonii.AAC.1
MCARGQVCVREPCILAQFSCLASHTLSLYRSVSAHECLVLDVPMPLTHVLRVIVQSTCGSAVVFSFVGHNANWNTRWLGGPDNGLGDMVVGSDRAPHLCLCVRVCMRTR